MAVTKAEQEKEERLAGSGQKTAAQERAETLAAEKYNPALRPPTPVPAGGLGAVAAAAKKKREEEEEKKRKMSANAEAASKASAKTRKK